MVPGKEWDTLLSRIEADHRIQPQEILAPLKDKIGFLKIHGTDTHLAIAMENLAVIQQALYGDDDRVSVHPILPGVGNEATPEISFEAQPFSDPEKLEQQRVRLLGEWVSFYGPMTVASVKEKTGIKSQRLHRIVHDLIEAGSLLKGQFVRGGPEKQICDRENIGILLRLQREAARPSFDPLPLSALPYFVARNQGLVKRKRGKKQLVSHMDQLSCFCASAALWETDILPARLDNYDTSWLDTAMQENDLMWVGCGREKICFCFQPDLDLIQREDGWPEPDRPVEYLHGDSDQTKHGATLHVLFPDTGAGYDFWSLQRRTDMPVSKLSRILWEGVWRGIVTNDTVVSLRKGIENRFTVPEHGETTQNTRNGQRRVHKSMHRRGFRNRFSKWKGALPYIGNWRKMEKQVVESDILEAAERTKERVRLLLDRYGILFRELLFKEPKPFQWQRLFRALRLMELSGEIVSGYFFKDIPGPQFISRKGFQHLRSLSPGKEVFWLNALDPASLCGVPIQSLKDHLPPKIGSTHLVYCGDRLVLVSRRNGRELTFHVNADDPDIQSYLGVLRHLMSRQFQALRQVTVETINGLPAAESPFLNALKLSFDTLVEYKQVVLYRKLGSL
jgi:ATP-dependent Lhr-like helicase